MRGISVRQPSSSSSSFHCSFFPAAPLRPLVYPTTVRTSSSYRPPPPPQMRKNLSPSEQERDSPRYQKAGTFFTTKIIHSSIPSPIKQFRKIFIFEKNFPSPLSDRLIASPSPPPFPPLQRPTWSWTPKEKSFFATTTKKAKMEREEEENWTQLRSGVGDLVTSLITGRGQKYIVAFPETSWGFFIATSRSLAKFIFPLW